MEQTNLFFEIEDLWGKDLINYYNPQSAINLILNELEEYGYKACFFVSGKSAEDYPKLIKQIHKKGHEIALHGYAHENFIQLEENGVESVLTKSENAIKKIIGEKPIGIRSPLKAANKRIYSAFALKNYKWASNDHSLLAESFEEPGKFSLMAQLKGVVSNINHHFFYNKKPYKNDTLIEFPILSSSERDILKMVCVNHNTPDDWIDFVIRSLKKQYKRSFGYFNLNFHTWAIATGNRIKILKELLGFISMKKVDVVLPRDLL